MLRLQGLHPAWLQDVHWEYFMHSIMALEGQQAWLPLLACSDPRHPNFCNKDRRITPTTIMVECTGLGGGDLNLSQPWHVCIRTNTHKQQVYGPSLALLEESVRTSDQSTIHFTGLGLTKSLQEFLVLHYYATDSADSWYNLLSDCFPQVRWPSPGRLRHLARDIFKRIHVAPSHRRAPHPCWTGAMNLVLRLLLDPGRRQIVSFPGTPPPTNVMVRGFSAGSFVGLTVLHLLWRQRELLAQGILGGIACPPALLGNIPHDKMRQVVLIHYHADQLCMWRPAEGHPLSWRTVYVHSNWKHLNHFGNHEHSYSHWLENVPAPGIYPVWKVMLDNPDMANPQKRDASALRLLSWLSFSLDSNTSVLLGKLMKQLATEDESNPAILRIVQESKIGATWGNLAEIHAGLMDQITVSNLAQTNDTISQLYRTFLARLSFPRLVHFLDLVLPQMLPHQRIREQNQVRHLTSHWLSLLEQERSAYTPVLHLNFLFSSHAGLVHVLIEWYRNPLLVFSDYPKVQRVPLETLRNATTLDTYRQHVAMGIRSGQSALFAFESEGSLYKMIGILITSNVPPSVAKENRHWKHVAPHQTELAILPPELAETFCREALEGFQNHQHYEYIEDWIGIFSPTEGGRVPVKMHHIELLGETRSADDLGVFSQKHL